MGRGRRRTAAPGRGDGTDAGGYRQWEGQGCQRKGGAAGAGGAVGVTESEREGKQTFLLAFGAREGVALAA